MTAMERIKNLLEKSFPDSEVQVGDMTGTQDHLEIHIAAKEFEGLTLIKQHQLVYDCLRESFSDFLHAVKIKTQIHKV